MSESSPKRLAVLLADDSADVRSALAGRLRALGHTVTCAETGREALDFLNEQYFDIVVTDVMMPEASGLEIIDETRRRYPSARVLVLSGGDHPIDSMRELEAAATARGHASLVKPFTAEEFMAALRRIVPSSDTTTPFPALLTTEIERKGIE